MDHYPTVPPVAPLWLSRAPRVRRGMRLWVGAALCAAAVLAMARPAGAHTFLVRTDPAQGARLADAPSQVSLEFSEAFSGTGARVEITVDGRRQDVMSQQVLGGRVLRADLADRRPGIYVVSWSVVADDGHETAGEFAFAVGQVGGAIPRGRASAPGASLLDVLAGWVFLAGFALAAGSVAMSWARRAIVDSAAARVGLSAGMVGAAVQWGRALGTGKPARQEILLAAVTASMAVVSLAIRGVRRRWPIGVGLAAAGVAWSARGHSGVANGALGTVVDAVHLIAGATWVGALVLLVVELSGRRVEASPWAVAGRYSRLATLLVAVLAAAGLTSAWLLLSGLSDLWDTGYGRLLLMKTALFVGALGLAWVARRRGLGGRRLGLLRRTTRAEAALVVAVLVVTAVLVNTAPPAPARSVAGLLGPPPIVGPVVRDAGMAGILTVGVSAGEGQLRVEVFAPGGSAPEGLAVKLEAAYPDGRDATLVPRPCGPGCLSQQVRWPAGVTRLTVSASARDWRGGTFVAEVPSPVPTAEPALLTELVARMRAVPSVRFVERTSSGPDSVVSPTTFQLSAAEFLAAEPWGAGVADDVRPLPGGGGFRLYLSGDRIWVTLWLDGQGRLARERVVDVGHVVDDDGFQYPAP